MSRFVVSANYMVDGRVQQRTFIVAAESIIEAMVSVKGVERETFSQMDEATTVERLRYTWS